MKFEYRLVENCYRNRIEWEDGPGSLQNIVSDRRTRVVREWGQQDEVFESRILASGLSGLELDSDDGRDQYSYYLERRPLAGGKWKFTGIVKALPEPDDDF